MYKMNKQNLTITLITILAILTFTLPSFQTVNALIPIYNPRPTPSSILDMMMLDPFKILEHSPIAPFQRDPVSESVSTIALARADWKETPTSHEISLDIPGMKRDDIKIEIDAENRVLSVSGERKTEQEVKDEMWHRAERTVGRFWRQFRLPGNADVENVKARLVDGVLRVSVEKLGEVEMKKKEPKVISIDDQSVKGNDQDVVKTSSKHEL